MNEWLFLFLCGVAAGLPAGICLGTILYGKYGEQIERFLDQIL